MKFTKRPKLATRARRSSATGKRGRVYCPHRMARKFTELRLSLTRVQVTHQEPLGAIKLPRPFAKDQVPTMESSLVIYTR